MPAEAAPAAPAGAAAAAAAQSPQQHPQQSQQQRRARRLVAFDFDHTIADANSDTFILKALPEGEALPAELKASYQPGRWTEWVTE